MSWVANPKGNPHDTSGSPAVTALIAKRCPSITVSDNVIVRSLKRMVEDLSSCRIAMATLSSGAATRATEAKRKGELISHDINRKPVWTPCFAALSRFEPPNVGCYGLGGRQEGSPNATQLWVSRVPA